MNKETIKSKLRRCLLCREFLKLEYEDGLTTAHCPGAGAHPHKPVVVHYSENLYEIDEAETNPS